MLYYLEDCACEQVFFRTLLHIWKSLKKYYVMCMGSPNNHSPVPHNVYDYHANYNPTQHYKNNLWILPKKACIMQHYQKNRFPANRSLAILQPAAIARLTILVVMSLCRLANTLETSSQAFVCMYWEFWKFRPTWKAFPARYTTIS